MQLIFTNNNQRVEIDGKPYVDAYLVEKLEKKNEFLMLVIELLNRAIGRN